MKVVVYTADVGGYDEAHPIIEQRGADVIRLAKGRTPFDASDQVASRWLKWHPDVALGERLGNWDIWVDAAVEVISPSFALDFIGAGGPADIVVCRHPLHQTLKAEVAAIEALPSCRFHPHHRAQVALSEAQTGFSPPVAALGVIARRSARTRSLSDVWARGYAWSSECIRDQTIFPFVVADHGYRVAVIDPPGGDFWGNSWWVRHPHREAR